MTESIPGVANYISTKNQHLGSLLKQIKHMQALHTLLGKAVPEQKTLFEHCYVLRPDATSLLLIAENPHWVTRLRFLIPTLLTALQHYPELSGLKAIYCKVLPPLYRSRFVARKKRSRMLISQQSATLLGEAAHKIKDPKISRILKKLAIHPRSENEEDTL